MDKQLLRINLIFAAMALFIGFSVITIYFLGQNVITDNAAITDRLAVITAVDETLSTLKDAETGQRGYLLTSNPEYLAPYNAAIATVSSDLNTLHHMAATNKLSPAEVQDIDRLTQAKLAELAKTIELQKKVSNNSALDLVRTNVGNDDMAQLRDVAAAIDKRQRDRIDAMRQDLTLFTVERSLGVVTIGLINIIFLAWIYSQIRRMMGARERALVLVAEQRELLAVTLKSIGDAVIVTDTAANITFMNAEAEKLTGWLLADANGKPAAEIFRIINEESRLTVESPIDKVLRLGIVVGLANHTLLIRRDGTEISIDDSGAPVRDGAGKVHGVVLVFRDFSLHKSQEEAIRKSEERLRFAIDAADLGTFYCAIPLDKIVWNDKCKAHFWLPPGAEVDFKIFYERMHPDDRARTQQAIEHAQNNRAIYDVEYRTVSPRSEIRWLRALGRFYYNAEGQPMRFDGITIDVSNKKETERQLQDAIAAAEQANQAKDQFLAALSHELRTPLTPVLATLTTWEMGGTLPPSLQADIQVIRRNVELEARLIDDLLDLTRIVKGKLVLNPEITDVHDLLMHVNEICRSEVNTKRIHMQLNLAAAAHYVHADPSRLQQVFWNIMRNATKFSTEGGHIEVETANADGTVIITIRDHGIGMEAENLARIFQPFQQGSDLITRRFGGLGLGLAISKTLVDVQGGSLTAFSEGLGHGATFTIRLPIAATAGNALGAPDPQPAAPQHVRILLVEDHLDTGRTMSRLLSLMGHKVQLCATAGDALKAMRSQSFDIIVSDIGLPDANGLQLMTEIRTFSNIPAIALTGFGMEEDVLKTKAAGFDAHLTKPVNFQRLESIIDRISKPKSPSPQA